MPDQYKANKIQSKVCGCLCVGLGGLLILWSLNFLFSIPRESELIKAAGVPKALEAIERRDRYGDVRTTLAFQLDGHPTEYADSSPQYGMIADVVKANKPVTAWLSPNSKSIFPLTDKMPIYKFESDGNVILSYSEAVEGAHFGLCLTSILGVGLVLAGVWCFSTVQWQNKLVALHDSIKQ